LREIFRVLKPGGHFSISDIVLMGNLPEVLREDAEMYSGCVSGAIQKADYLNKIKEAGFEAISLQKEKPIVIPDDILSKYLNIQEMQAFQNGQTGIYSITVLAIKPGHRLEKKRISPAESNIYCEPNLGCC